MKDAIEFAATVFFTCLAFILAMAVGGGLYTLFLYTVVSRLININ